MSDLIFHVFIPHNFFANFPPQLLYGYYKTSDKCVLINCIFSVPFDQDTQLFFVKQTANHFNFLKIGLLSSREYVKQYEDLDFSKHFGRQIYFDICYDQLENEVHVNKFIFNEECINPCNIYLIIYDGNKIKDSQLLLREEKMSGVSIFEDSFVDFLADSIDVPTETRVLINEEFRNNKAKVHDESDILYPVEPMEKSSYYCSLCNLVFHFFRYFLMIVLQCFNFIQWLPQFLKAVLFKTMLVKQFHRQLLHLSSVSDELQKSNSLSLRSKNILAAIFLDLAIGCLLTNHLHAVLTYQNLVTAVLSNMNTLVDWLQWLLHWLMGVPAGLKLNIPLNSALGHFFLYHIYFWRSYIAITLPIFNMAIAILSRIRFLGLTFLLSSLVDLISLVTVHIYCFYGYASSLYYYQLQTLSTLWRVFRGKRWNPENQRVESFTYDVHNLYIGTLLFTVLLFLLPTVMVYYFVFATLHVIVLIVQGIISRVIAVATVFPLYVILLRMCHSRKTAGGIYFLVMQSHPVLVLTMDLVQLDVMSVVRKTMPPIQVPENGCSAKSFASALLQGNFVHNI